MKITVESDTGKIYSYEGARAVFLTVDMVDGYKQLVDGAVSPAFVTGVATSVEAFTKEFLHRMMKIIPEENLKELMDMIENGVDDEEEDAEEDAEDG